MKCIFKFEAKKNEIFFFLEISSTFCEWKVPLTKKIYTRKIRGVVLFLPINKRNAFVCNPCDSFSVPCIIDIKSNIIDRMNYILSTSAIDKTCFFNWIRMNEIALPQKMQAAEEKKKYIVRILLKWVSINPISIVFSASFLLHFCFRLISPIKRLMTTDKQNWIPLSFDICWRWAGNTGAFRHICQQNRTIVRSHWFLILLVEAFHCFCISISGHSFAIVR